MSIEVAANGSIEPQEIIDLQIRSGSQGWGVGDTVTWQDAISYAVATVTARNADGLLVGIGFLIGNSRHAEICDVVVDPAYRRQGIGRRITSEIMKQIKANRIRYVSLVRDPASPFLEAFYRDAGFEPLSIAMGFVNEEI